MGVKAKDAVRDELWRAQQALAEGGRTGLYIEGLKFALSAMEEEEFEAGPPFIKPAPAASAEELVGLAERLTDGIREIARQQRETLGLD